MLAVNEQDSKAALGGKARAENLTPERRSEIARQGAVAKHAQKPAAPILPEATHEGTMKIGGVDIACAVLEDGRRLITQSGFMVALGRARQAKGRAYYDGDVNLPAFLTAKNLRPFISKELEVTSSQLEFKPLKGARAFGYAAELLPKVLDVYIDAMEANALTEGQNHVGERAKILMRGLAHVGIAALIDEATGYQGVRPQDALQKYLELIIRKELAAWVKKFPDEFYQNIYTLRRWVWPGMTKNRYSVVAKYTTNLIYERMAPGLLRELELKAPKDNKGNRPHKLHQWLTDELGNPMLAQHMHSIIMIQRVAIASGFGWNRFIKMVDQAMPRRGETLELPGFGYDEAEAA